MAQFISLLLLSDWPKLANRTLQSTEYVASDPESVTLNSAHKPVLHSGVQDIPVHKMVNPR